MNIFRIHTNDDEYLYIVADGYSIGEDLLDLYTQSPENDFKKIATFNGWKHIANISNVTDIDYDA